MFVYYMFLSVCVCAHARTCVCVCLLAYKKREGLVVVSDLPASSCASLTPDARPYVAPPI